MLCKFIGCCVEQNIFKGKSLMKCSCHHSNFLDYATKRKIKNLLSDLSCLKVYKLLIELDKNIYLFIKQFSPQDDFK